MQCATKNSIGTGARCDWSCGGEPSTGESGCNAGSLVWPVIVEAMLPAGWAPTQPINGQQETAATPQIGDEADALLFPNIDEAPRASDRRVLRWAAIGLLSSWLLIVMAILAFMKGHA
jgi:hypothetical protein